MQSKRLKKAPSKYQKSVEGQVRLLSSAIRIKREKLGLTQEQIAEELNVATTTIQSIEQGRRYPSMQLFLVLLAHLKITIRLDT